MPAVRMVIPPDLITLDHVHCEAFRMAHSGSSPPVAAHRTRGSVFQSLILMALYDVNMALENKSHIVLGAEPQHFFGISNR